MPQRVDIIPQKDLPDFRRQLLAWFHSNKRDLDWRRTQDPYRIWLSEIMLQQTRVAAVIPYYQRFLERFPTVHDLARARIESVLPFWAGLGYYSRARNLHNAARQIVEAHGGEFPRGLDHALALPGVGSYTAAAVLSIAYSAPHAVLDGNVARVLARLGAIRGDLREPRRWRGLAQSADVLIAPDSPGDWNQAMMELGAMVCTPRAPRCEECPVARWCRARKQDLTGKIPATRKKPTTVQIKLAAAVLLDPKGRTLLLRQRNHQGALFSRLWQFPALETNPRGEHELVSYLESTFNQRRPQLEPLGLVRHTVTFRDIRLTPFLVRVSKLPAAENVKTPQLTEIGRLSVSGITKKIAAAALRAI